ncbi:YkgJ family cysteine cluster protein [Halomicrococcus gelatinilyticus]|uniref:YkgJ family cysteine cluster protein n=1 Tax=Halomicrococcus gelatinilyticus TaxID=1702103 RepID=UPI002E105BB8
MEVNCEGCAGCCIDWRAVGDGASDHERRGARRPLDDAYNLVPLTRDDARAFLDAGLADALTPRLWRADDGAAVDGVELAAIDGQPVFFLGLRQTAKPVEPFGTDAHWLPTCVFLDPTTLQCRIHDREEYPTECAEYPGHNLELDAETECERVESAFGGERLLDGDPPTSLSGLLLGPQAVGQKVFVYPDPDDLDGVVDRARADELTADDRARFVAAAVAARPGTTDVDRERFETALERAAAADSWAGRAVAEWEATAGTTGDEAPDPDVAERIEDDRGAPSTPGW